MLEEVTDGVMEIREKGEREPDDAAEAQDPTEPPADVNFDPATEKAEPADDFQAIRASAVGLNAAGLSSVPASTIFTPGITSASATTPDPQFGQKRR